MTLTHDNPIVLVVDDSPDSLGMINLSLNQAGYTVLVALNGDQAITIAQQIRPDVILLDAVMPVMNGFECCRKLRVILPLTPVIFMTGLTEVEDTVRAFECGGNDYITKPIKPEELLARIRTHINNANMIGDARDALDIAKQYVFSVNAKGEILWTTPQTLALLSAIHAMDSTHLTDALNHWINTDKPNQELVVGGFERPLVIRYYNKIGQQEHLLRIIEHEEFLNTELLQKALPVTKREAEVLLWIVQGKTNREIAEILEMSPRTVNKHLENIFQKIQVDNRTSAASLALQALMGQPYHHTK